MKLHSLKTRKMPIVICLLLSYIKLSTALGSKVTSANQLAADLAALDQVEILSEVEHAEDEIVPLARMMYRGLNMLTGIPPPE